MNIESLKLIFQLVAKNAGISAEIEIIEPRNELLLDVNSISFLADQIRIITNTLDQREALKILIEKEIRILLPVDSISSATRLGFLSDSFHYSSLRDVTVISNNAENSVDGFKPQLVIQLRYYGVVVKNSHPTIVDIGRATSRRMTILSLKITANDSAFSHNTRIKIEDISSDQFKVIAIGDDHEMSMLLVRVLFREMSRRIIAGFKPHATSTKKISKLNYRTTFLIGHSSEISLVTPDHKPMFYVQFVDYIES